MAAAKTLFDHPWEEKYRKLRLRWTTLSHDCGGVQPQHHDPVIAGHLVYFHGILRASYYCRVFNTNTLTWHDAKVLPATRYNDAQVHPDYRYDYASALAEDKIYVFGGKLTEVKYVPGLIEHDLVLSTTREVVIRKNSPGLRAELTAVYVPWRKEIVYFGGRKQTGSQYETIQTQNDTFALNVDRLCWQSIHMKGTLPESRQGHSAKLVGNSMFIYGGVRDKRPLEDIWVANMRVTDPSWSNVIIHGRAPDGRVAPAFEYFSGMFVLFGGYNRAVFACDDLNLFSIAKGEWISADDSEIEGLVPIMAHAEAVRQFDGLLFFNTDRMFKLEFL